MPRFLWILCWLGTEEDRPTVDLFISKQMLLYINYRLERNSRQHGQILVVK